MLALQINQLILEIIVKENLLENARIMGDKLLQGLNDLSLSKLYARHKYKSHTSFINRKSLILVPSLLGIKSL